jgi:hypothetical protein
LAQCGAYNIDWQMAQALYSFLFFFLMWRIDANSSTASVRNNSSVCIQLAHLHLNHFVLSGRKCMMQVSRDNSKGWIDVEGLRRTAWLDEIKLASYSFRASEENNPNGSMHGAPTNLCRQTCFAGGP